MNCHAPMTNNCVKIVYNSRKQKVIQTQWVEICAREWNIRSYSSGGETRALKCDSYNRTHAYSVQDRCEQISQRIPPLLLHTHTLLLTLSLVANRIILIIIIFLFNRIFFLLMSRMLFRSLWTAFYQLVSLAVAGFCGVYLLFVRLYSLAHKETESRNKNTNPETLKCVH